MVATFRGVFLTSDNPQETARFYRVVAGLPLEQVGDPNTYVYWILSQNGMELAIHDSAAFAEYTDPPLRGSNTTHLYFQIDDYDTFLVRLRSIGITPVDADDVVITVEDPDGRKVMFGTA